MKRVLSIFFLLLFVPATSGLADDKGAISKAQGAAKAWLVLVDGAKYGESWDEAASLLKAAVTKADFERTLKGVRAPLGPANSRTLKSATFSRTLPGVPAGEYVVIQFDTRFENKAVVVETVTPTREKDGSWRVSGYYIK